MSTAVETIVSNSQPVTDEDLDDVSECTDVSPITADSVLHTSFPLKDHWKFWFLDSHKIREWLERLHEVCVIDTVESFWALMDNIRPASIMFNCDYCLFRDNIQPVWEVEQNRDGGRLVLMIQKVEMDILNELWEKLLVALIGNRFGEHTHAVCGAVCNIRQKGSKITLWTNKASDINTNKAIGAILREVWEESHLKFMEKRKIKYESHADAQTKQSSTMPYKFEC